MIEIERRFLCRISDESQLAGAPSWQIEQGYLTTSGPSIRIRRRDDDYFLTIKSGQGLVRNEYEFRLPAESGHELLELSGTHSLRKTRYRLGRWEVDRFQGALDGLVLAEVELETEDEPLPELPDGIILGREVTLDQAYSNRSLALLTEEAARRFVQRVLAESSA